jgi:RNA polymerase sigma-70 factor (ECF subfamily)
MRDSDANSTEQAGSTSNSLLARVRRADEEAWKRLVTLYGPLVHQWCRTAQLQSDDLADVFQDIFTTVHRSIQDFRSDRPGDSFRGWLRTIVRSKLVDHFRRQATQPVAAGGSQAVQRLRELPADEPDLERHAETENEILVRRAAELVRAEFAEHTWRAFWQTAVEGRPAKDVADDLNLSVVAVRQAKSRVLRRLRAEFSDLVDVTRSA